MFPLLFGTFLFGVLIIGWLVVAGVVLLVTRRKPPAEPRPDSQADLAPPTKRRNEPESYRSIEWKGLIFRSYSEVKIAKTLDHRRIFFIPATRVRMDAWGKKDLRQTRELDFVICHEGKWGILEVDGPYHVAQADEERDSLLRMHGISNIQRFPSQRCYQEPQAVVDEFLSRLK